MCAKLAGIEIAHISVKFSQTVRKNVQGLSADSMSQRMDGWTNMSST